jgi:1-acyl-sn-glycerol-3-phosphate acyltransferase
MMTEWEYHTPPDIDETMSEHLRNFPRQPYMLIYAIRSAAALLLRAWMRFYHRLRVEGWENLPGTGSFVLVCNHTSHLDTLSMLCSVPLKRLHQTFPAAAADYFFSSQPRSAVSAILINALPFDRKFKGAESLTVCSELLSNDGNVLIIFPEGTRTTTGELGRFRSGIGIFPEGTRTTTGELGRFRSGIGRLLAGKDLPVLPCHLDGGLRAWPKGKMIPRPFSLRLRIGAPRSYGHLEKTSESVRQICQELQESVAELGRRNT